MRSDDGTLIRRGDEDTLAPHLDQGQLDAPVKQEICRGMRLAGTHGDFDLIPIADDDRDGIEHRIVFSARLVR